MAQESFLRTLQCPYCGGELELDGRFPAQGLEVEFGTLRCGCYRYGIVLGIVVLRQESPAHDNSDRVVEALDRHDHDGAVELLLAGEVAGQRQRRGRLGGWAERLRGRTPGRARDALEASADLRAALRQWRPNHYGEYLEHRYGNPSLLTAIPVIAAMAKTLTGPGGASRRPRVLDLGCGVGHTTYLMTSLVPEAEIVAADLDFLNLALAKRHVVPGASFVCCDAEAGLPFRDGVFDAVFSLDCVHYIRGKRRLAAELRRIGAPDARFALSHLHNVARANPNQGIPLSAEEYARVFGPLGGNLYAEHTLFEGFTADGALPLQAAGEAASKQVADAFVLLALGDRHAEVAAARLDRYMAERLSCFSLNGLYASAPGDGTSELRLRWPSETLRSECCAGVEPLRERVPCGRSLLDAVAGRRFHELPAETFEALIRSFVLVPQPSLGAHP